MAELLKSVRVCGSTGQEPHLNYGINVRVSWTRNAYEMNGFVEGATYDSIVRYVLKNMKITYARAGYLVMEVLKVGVALGRIKRTPQATYLLVSDKPDTAMHKVTEPRFSDDTDVDDDGDALSDESA